jgi:ABC-2 type transport system permease protein
MTSAGTQAFSLPPTGRPRISLLRVVRHQVRFDLIALSRSKQALFFILAMPLGFLVLFSAMFGNGHTLVFGQNIPTTTYYVANLTCFAIIDVAFMNLTITLVESRESGVFRRREATPQATSTIIIGRSATAILTTLVTCALLLILGRFAYHAAFPLNGLGPLAVALAIGCVASCALAFATSAIIRSSTAAQPVTMALALPLFFISGVFVPWQFVPRWLQHVALVFPLRHLSLALLAPFVNGRGSGLWRWDDLFVVAAWGAAGFLVAARAFKFSPRDF